jgi:hypothetical protein
MKSFRKRNEKARILSHVNIKKFNYRELCKDFQKGCCFASANRCAESRRTFSQQCRKSRGKWWNWDFLEVRDSFRFHDNFSPSAFCETVVTIRQSISQYRSALLAPGDFPNKTLGVLLHPPFLVVSMIPCGIKNPWIRNFSFCFLVYAGAVGFDWSLLNFRPPHERELRMVSGINSEPAATASEL